MWSVCLLVVGVAVDVVCNCVLSVVCYLSCAGCWLWVLLFVAGVVVYVGCWLLLIVCCVLLVACSLVFAIRCWCCSSMFACRLLVVI